ncbi:MAG: AbrB/MazE/SpoVT family DNA-binding domain-containing protein [Planctomycetota bacterium]|nr:AbrB/MazE/SpoVT family DNA-binding domain-containing protein [Planctomycetota bacterium]
MRIKLSAIGDGLGLVLDRAVLERLKIDQDTELEVTTDGVRLIVEPVRGRRERERLGEVAERVMDAHDDTFRRLAE